MIWVSFLFLRNLLKISYTEKADIKDYSGTAKLANDSAREVKALIIEI